MHSVATVLFLVVLATAVATGARRWRIPAPSLLVVAGLVVGMLPGVPDVHVTPEVIGTVVLPPLLYASAEELSGRDLKAVWRPVTVLAVGLVLFSAAAVAAVAALLTPLPLSAAFVLGAVLASTDPVAVTALGRRLALPPRIQVLVQAESLFNDATSLVLFRVAVSVAAASGVVTWQAAGGQFVALAGGGGLAGLAVAGVVALIRRRTADPVLETVIALVTPYAAYVLAEAVQASGVTAVVVAGVVLGSSGHRLTTAPVRLQLHAVYGTVVFLLESVVFSLIGLELPSLIRALTDADRLWPVQAVVLAVVLMTVRMLWVFPLSAVLHRKHAAGTPSWRVAAVTSWAGTRGVMPLAAALSIPLATDGGAGFPQRGVILVLTTSVVVITLVAQGFTLAPLVRRSGVALEPAHTRREETEARHRVVLAGLRHLEQMADLEAVPDVLVARLRREMTTRLDLTRQLLDEDDPVESMAATYRQLRREVIAVEVAELRRLHDDHLISDTTRRRLQRSLDLEETRLADS
ncbi:Na+/H+ antiporter [Streptomyces albospinus]|uniref:Na+/H+ antiporter n=1 Tax=Streptomyces albospinus TaxID=285515 RepID=A0ABQ2V5W9_9ACTN|nr:Na+/H+ antiporter [Streptomyces albospinus]GGU70486.1 Na+/H+ antiporter [Streptomyces albospinus]